MSIIKNTSSVYEIASLAETKIAMVANDIDVLLGNVFTKTITSAIYIFLAIA
jgi:hypothetical protein